MARILLIRHAVADHTGKRLYGRSQGVALSERGRADAEGLAERLRRVRIHGLYVSPMQRCRETAETIARGRRLEPEILEDLNEVDYGDWTGRTFASLRRTKVWRQVRTRPSTARFPNGESLLEVQERAVRAIEGIARRHRRGVAAVVTHGDVIRLALAHYAGLHLDLFQRLEASTASVTALALGDGIPRVLRANDTGRLEDLVPGKVGG
ncbi:MAG TPA: MSMEG_4193 family putative phosphomutase [Actinomycetota bacterium]